MYIVIKDRFFLFIVIMYVYDENHVVKCSSFILYFEMLSQK